MVLYAPLILLTGGSFEVLNQDGKITLASISVFAVTAVLFFIIGFASGYSCQKRKNSATETVSPVGTQQLNPVYEDIGQPKNDKQQLELKENTAYGHIEKQLELKAKVAYGHIEEQLYLKDNASYGQVEKQLDLKANEAYGYTEEQLELKDTAGYGQVEEQLELK